MSENTPKMVGYWCRSEGDPLFPHPDSLVRNGWLETPSRNALLHYLRAAPQFEAYRGLSWCRFLCGVPDRTMGYREFWDGVWVWPEGLVHYVECHDVYLPDEFVSRAISSLPPTLLPAPTNPRALNFGFWLDWASKHSHDRNHHVA